MIPLITILALAALWLSYAIGNHRGYLRGLADFQNHLREFNAKQSKASDTLEGWLHGDKKI